MFAKYAQYYIDQGLSVFPVMSDKKPAIPGVIPFRTNFPTPEQIAEWSRGRMGGMNIGVICGKLSNLFVIDADTPAAVAKIESLLPDQYKVPSVTTPKGGRHFNFRHAPGFENWVRCRAGIDIRTENSYVLLPPSQTKATPDGKCIDGEYKQHKGEDIKDRGPLPEEVAAYLREGKVASGKTQDAETPPLSDGRRHNDMFKAACGLIDQNLPQDLVNRIIVNVAKECNPPLPEKEALLQAEGAWKHCRKNPRAADDQDIEFDPASVLMTGAEMQTLDIHVDWTVDKLIPERGLTLIYGPGGVGKTWLALAIAQAVAKGEPFLGLPTKQKPVFYIDRENPWPLLVERVRKMDIRDVRFWHLSFGLQPPKLDAPTWEIYKKLPTGGLIFFDTARSCHDGDENSSKDVGLIMNRLKELRELDNDLAILHHTPRVNERAAKGSTAWEDLADQVLAFYRVRKGSLKEIKEEIDTAEYDPDALYHLGTGKKTRYTPVKFYITADYEKGVFTLAEDPGTKAINMLAEHIAGEGGGQNQTEIIKWAKENLDGSTRTENLIALLKRGTREKRWRVRPGFKGAKYYEPPK